MQATMQLNCPECGTAATLDLPVERSTTEFCTNPACDFPLFWAKGVEGLATGDAVTPGGGEPGPATVAVLPAAPARPRINCPDCGADNFDADHLCVKCGAILHPHPEPVAAWFVALLAVVVTLAVIAATVGLAITFG